MNVGRGICIGEEVKTGTISAAGKGGDKKIGFRDGE
jgi:hypothetical protein